jgi:hypothetical protein
MTAIVQPTDNESADSGQAGTAAVSSPTDTGHGATTCSVSIGAEDSDSETKSARWFTFAPMSPRAIALQFSWSISGAGLTLTGALPGTTEANALFLVEYSTNGGSSWSTAVTRTFNRVTNGTTAISDSGSVNLVISTVALSEIQVRDRIRADATSAADPSVAASAEILATISDIQLEVEQQMAYCGAMM